MLRRLTIAKAIEIIESGGVIAFPTETSYGIGCRAYDPEAVARIVDAKGRPDGKPLPVLLPSIESLRRLIPHSPLCGLGERFWPLPLTLVIPAFLGLAASVTAGTSMVGVRVSASPIASAIVRAQNEPVVATSANLSGHPAATTAAGCDCLTGLDGVVDGGTVEGGASTVVGIEDGELVFFREGAVARAEIEAAWADLRGGALR